jgi:hypothetical protein
MVLPAPAIAEVKTVEKPESIGSLLARALMTPWARTAGAAAMELAIVVY